MDKRKIERILEGRIIDSQINPTKDKKEELIETRNYKITGKSYQLDKIEQLFSLINYLGSDGHSSQIIIDYDGDGNARLSLRRAGKNKLLFPNEHLNFYLQARGEISQISFERFLELLDIHGKNDWCEEGKKCSIYFDYNDNEPNKSPYGGEFFYLNID